VLAAQQHADTLIAALLASRGRPSETAALQQYLDDAHAVARAAVSAANGTAAPPAAAAAVLEELGALTGPGAAASALASPAGGLPRQLAPVTAFGVTIADIMLHGRHDDPDPVIAAWLAGNTASRRNTTSPADVLIHWDQASPAGEGVAALPSLMWPGWALRLMPPGDFDFLRYRTALAMMLAIAVTGAEDFLGVEKLVAVIGYPAPECAHRAIHQALAQASEFVFDPGRSFGVAATGD
jgi:hypothetical protein